ncbi:MAG: hypothetical protein ACI892_002335, partial [Marinobacter maritimus]
GSGFLRGRADKLGESLAKQCKADKLACAIH